MYKPFVYKKLTQQFHYFDAEDCIAGLNFACPIEAAKFEAIIANRVSKTLMRSVKMKSTRKSNLEENVYLDATPSLPKPLLSLQPVTLNVDNNTPDTPVSPQKVGFFGKIKETFGFKSKPEGKKKALSGFDISNPTGFEHRQHVGSNANTGAFDVNYQIYFMLQHSIFFIKKKKKGESSGR